MHDEGETLLYKMLIGIKEKINNRIYTNKGDIEKKIEEIAFIVYLSLILTAYIEKRIREKEVLKNYTKKEIIYELKKLKLT